METNVALRHHLKIVAAYAGVRRMEPGLHPLASPLGSKGRDVGVAGPAGSIRVAGANEPS
jgi:hypothetical protein